MRGRMRNGMRIGIGAIAMIARPKMNSKKEYSTSYTITIELTGWGSQWTQPWL